MTPEQINAAKQKLNIDLSTVSDDRLVELCLLNRAVPSASPDFLTRLKAELERRFTPDVLANDDTMFSVLHKFAQSGGGSAINPDQFLPKSGGTLEGSLKVAYANPHTGMSVANTKADGVSAGYGAMLGNIVKGSLKTQFASDGSANFALQLTPPGDTNRNRTEDYLRVNEDGIWSKKYGMLHEFFAQAAGGEGISHKTYTNFSADSYGRKIDKAEVWRDKKSKLKIMVMQITSPHTGEYRLPEGFSGIWIPLLVDEAGVGKALLKKTYTGYAPNIITLSGTSTTYPAYVFAIGWSDQ